MKINQVIAEVFPIYKNEYNPASKRDYVYSDKGLEKRKLPGNNDYTYTIAKNAFGDPEVTILDPKNPEFLVGRLALWNRPEMQGYGVRTIFVNPKYRKQGIAKALYGLILLPPPVGLGATLISGEHQTPGGIKNWVSLSKIPGVEVTGLIRIYKHSDIKSKYKYILDLLEKVGATFYNEHKNFWFYEIPVELYGTKLENTIKNSIIKIYTDEEHATDAYDSFLMAKYL